MTEFLKSDSIAKLAAALVAAQADLQNPAFDSKNPFFHSEYASLKSHLETVKPVLARYGLTLLQAPFNPASDCVGVRTLIMHTSGEFIGDAAAVKLPGATGGRENPAQAAVAIITYLRRAGLAAILSVVGEPDDDGNSLQDHSRQDATFPPQDIPPRPPRQSAPRQPAPPRQGRDQDVDPATAREKLAAALSAIAETDQRFGQVTVEEIIGDILQEATSFYSKKDNKQIPGKRNLKDVSDKQTPVTWGHMKKDPRFTAILTAAGLMD